MTLNIKKVIRSLILGEVFDKVRWVWKKVKKIGERDAPIKLIGVYDMSGKGITNKYLNERKWTEYVKDRPTEIVEVRWEYDMRKFRYKYKISKPIKFPPYSLEDLRKNRIETRNKIMMIKVDRKEMKGMIEYAGPKHNFYEDATENVMKLEWFEPFGNEISCTTYTGKTIKVDNEAMRILL